MLAAAATITLMTTERGDLGPDGPPPEPTVQMNVRVPASLVERIDARRGKIGLSRDKWAARALDWALRQPERPTELRTRTARSIRRNQ